MMQLTSHLLNGWIRMSVCAALFALCGCLTGADDPKDAVGELVPQAETTPDELQFEWEKATSPTEVEPDLEANRTKEDKAGDEE